MHELPLQNVRTRGMDSGPLDLVCDQMESQQVHMHVGVRISTTLS